MGGDARYSASSTMTSKNSSFSEAPPLSHASRYTPTSSALSTMSFSKCGTLQSDVTEYRDMPWPPMWSRRPPSRILRSVKSVISCAVAHSTSPTTCCTSRGRCDSFSRNDSFGGVGNLGGTPKPPSMGSKVWAMCLQASSSWSRSTSVGSTSRTAGAAPSGWRAMAALVGVTTAGNDELRGGLPRPMVPSAANSRSWLSTPVASARHLASCSCHTFLSFLSITRKSSSSSPSGSTLLAVVPGPGPGQ